MSSAPGPSDISIVGLHAAVKMKDYVENLDILDQAYDTFEERAPELVEKLKANTPAVSGRLRRSTTFLVTQDSEGVHLIITQPAVNQGFPYRRTLELGRRPGYYIPIGVLKRFVYQKVKGARQEDRHGRYIIAARIARKIDARGTVPNPYPERTIKENEEMLARWSREIGTELFVQAASQTVPEPHLPGGQHPEDF